MPQDSTEQDIVESAMRDIRRLCSHTETVQRPDGTGNFNSESGAEIMVDIEERRPDQIGVRRVLADLPQTLRSQVAIMALEDSDVHVGRTTIVELNGLGYLGQMRDGFGF